MRYLLPVALAAALVILFLAGASWWLYLAVITGWAVWQTIVDRPESSAEPASVGGVLLRYVDMEGEETERIVTDLVAAEPEPGRRRRDPDLFRAYCHLRQDLRTFRLSRIVTAADAETGEIIEDLRSRIQAPPGGP